MRELRTYRAAVAFAVVFFTLLATLTGLFLWRGYNDALERAERTVFIAADAVAAHARWMVEASDQALMRLEDAAVVAPMQGGAQMEAALDFVAGALPEGLEVRLYDGTARRLTPGSPPAADADPLLRALPDNPTPEGILLSDYVPDLGGGRPGFLVARRLTEAGGAAETAAVVLPLDLLSDFWLKLSLGRDSTVSLIRDDGMLVARHPALAAPIDLSQHMLFTELLPRSSQGVYHSAASPADGVARIVAFSRVTDLPLVALASVSRAHSMRLYWQRVTRLALIGIPVILLLVALAVWLARLMLRDARAREDLRQAAERNHMLLREVHHRVKNNLQIIVSLIGLQRLPEEAENELRSRIMAMAALHEHLHLSRSAGTIALDGYLREIFSSVNEASGNRIKLHLELQEDIAVDADTATPLGLIANELITNANKYAFPDGKFGNMGARLSRIDNGLAELVIWNDGVPFDTRVNSKGLGVRLVRSLAHQVNPDYLFKGQSGLEFRISFPVKAPAPA